MSRMISIDQTFLTFIRQVVLFIATSLRTTSREMAGCGLAD